MAELARLLAHRRTGVATLRIVVVDLRPPAAILDSPEQTRLGTHRTHVAIASYLGGVVAVELAVREFVTSCGIEIFGTHLRVELVVETVLPERCGVGRAERARLERQTQIVAFRGVEHGTARGHIDRTCRGEVLGRLEDIAFLTVIDRDGLHIVHRETPEIDLPVLRIAQLHTVVEDAHVLRTHTADIDRFQSAHAAVVLDLNTRKIANRIGYRNHIQAFKLLPCKYLRGNGLGSATLCSSYNSVDPMDCIGDRVVAQVVALGILSTCRARVCECDDK